MQNLQTILGAGGSIGIELAKALPQYTENIRIVSHKPQKVNENDELFPADLTKASEVDKAIEGSTIVYVTIGFPYNIKVWRKLWPALIDNVIASCIKHKAKLVFFDNIYMYDKSAMGNITEDAPINPPSKKGQVRKQVASKIMEAVQKGELKALIARSADFYGPSIRVTSVLTETVFNPLAQGKKANWLGSLDCRHSYTFTPDAGKATALLGNTPEAYGQVWHLPTADDPPTGKEWVEMIAKAMNKKPAAMAAPKWIIQLMGIFIPLLREMPEMMYQNDRDYIFNSSKFDQAFDFRTTPYEEGIKLIVETDYSD